MLDGGTRRLDALRDPALEYAKKLEAAGVSTTVRIYPRVPCVSFPLDALLSGILG